MIMGVLGVWYNNFYGAQSHALLPYDQVNITTLTLYTVLCDIVTVGKVVMTFSYELKVVYVFMSVHIVFLSAQY